MLTFVARPLFVEETQLREIRDYECRYRGEEARAVPDQRALYIR